MPNQKNIQSVNSLVDKLKTSSNFVVVGFESTPHKKMEDLRRALKEAAKEPSFFEVIKKNLFKVAAQKIDKAELADDKVLFGPSAVMSLPVDWSERLATFFKFAKEDKSMKFKIGVIDGKVYQASDLQKLAQLPTKQELMGKMVGIMKSPQRKFVFALNFNMMKFVNVLKAKKDL
jgi:large subunit ribosomal protein L10